MTLYLISPLPCNTFWTWARKKWKSLIRAIQKNKYKNNTTLGRHCSRFHLDEPTEKEDRIQMIKNAISSVIADIRKDLCIDDDTRQKISKYNIEKKGTSLNNEVSKIFKQLKKTGDRLVHSGGLKISKRFSSTKR